jgi:hypothetical protein
MNIIVPEILKSIILVKPNNIEELNQMINDTIAK